MFLLLQNGKLIFLLILLFLMPISKIELKSEGFQIGDDSIPTIGGIRH